MKLIFQKIAVALAVLTVAPALSQAEQDLSEYRKMSATWERHIQAWENRDLDRILGDYTEESVILTNQDLYRGKAEIRRLFSDLFRFFDQVEYHSIYHTILPTPAKVIHILWVARQGETVYHGTDTFVVENGKIVYQTISAFPALPLP